jgi:hypothetical protein
MLQGYFDDSGSEPQSLAFVIAGYILPSEKMAAFADDWLIALHQKPRIEYFKMAEALSGAGEFSTMQIEFRKAKVRDMLSVIRGHKPRGLAVRGFSLWFEAAPSESSLGLIKRFGGVNYPDMFEPASLTRKGHPRLFR